MHQCQQIQCSIQGGGPWTIRHYIIIKTKLTFCYHYSWVLCFDSTQKQKGNHKHGFQYFTGISGFHLTTLLWSICNHERKITMINQNSCHSGLMLVHQILLFIIQKKKISDKTQQSGRNQCVPTTSDPRSYIQSIQSPISFASKSRAPGKCGILAWTADAVLSRKALFCFVWNLFFSIIYSRSHSPTRFLSIFITYPHQHVWVPLHHWYHPHTSTWCSLMLSELLLPIPDKTSHKFTTIFRKMIDMNRNYHIISYHISYHIISYHIISYHIISYHIISYHIISYHINFISIRTIHQKSEQQKSYEGVGWKAN